MDPARQGILLRYDKTASDVFEDKTVDKTKQDQAIKDGKWVSLEYPEIKQELENSERCYDKAHLKYQGPGRWGETDEYYGLEKVKSVPEKPIRGVLMTKFITEVVDKYSRYGGDSAREEAKRVVLEAQNLKLGDHLLPLTTVVRIKEGRGADRKLNLEVRRINAHTGTEEGPWEETGVPLHNSDMWKEVQMRMQQHGRATVTNSENVPFVRFRIKTGLSWKEWRTNEEAFKALEDMLKRFKVVPEREQRVRITDKKIEILGESGWRKVVEKSANYGQLVDEMFFGSTWDTIQRY